jgi:tRNA-dihydrouridine synthase
MEGLLDHSLRDTLTRVGGIDLCVSEFIRVTDAVLPKRAFYRVVPELLNAGKTVAGVPVKAQLLGSDPQVLAENAARLAKLNPAGIDLNFGCPAKTVNRHRGGAVLLDEPELIGQIVSAVRRAVPPHRPLKVLGPMSWWCMPEPKPMATDRPPTGTASLMCVNASSCPWWPMVKFGRWPMPCVAER